MNIKLERKIRVIKYKAILDIGRKIERSDFIALLLIAKANNNQLSKEIICKEFLFRDHEQMAENVLRRCIDRDLIDNEYRITKEGFEAINVGMIYEYYDGVCYIYVTNDPIIPQKILDFEFVDENINFRNEIRGIDESTPGLIDIPQWLKDIEEIENKQLFDTDKTIIKMKSISEKIELIEEMELPISIILTDKTCVLKTTGIFNDHREIFYFPKLEAVWIELLEDRIDEWDWNEGKLKVDYNLTENEKITFKKIINFKSPSLDKFGKFNPLSIEIDIKPKNENVANNWANWLLISKINDFLFDTTFINLKNEISQSFPNFNINFINHEKLVYEIKKKIDMNDIPNEFWFVFAPLDLIPINEKEIR